MWRYIPRPGEKYPRPRVAGAVEDEQRIGRGKKGVKAATAAWLRKIKPSGEPSGLLAEVRSIKGTADHLPSRNNASGRASPTGPGASGRQSLSFLMSRKLTGGKGSAGTFSFKVGLSATLAQARSMDSAALAKLHITALKQVSEAKEAAVRGLLFEEATLLRDREREVKNNLTKLGVKIDELTGDGAYGGAKVTIDEIESVAAMWSGIPVQRMTLDEAEILANMDEDLSGSVIGQEEAVSAVSRSLRRTRCGLKDPNRPIASMLFAGPTGVGKTELTKRLAEKYFGSEDNMVRLDMSEYMERHSVSKLVGAPPGYVGFGQGGTLTEAVRRKPFTILLFDEIEKAHPDVFNILLQMMEDGRLTDSQGRVVSFKNCLIVLTSNVGSKAISKGGGGLGFQLQDDDEEGSAEYRRIREKVLDELKNFFRPEMLNRLDEIVCFKQLEKESVQRIARLMLRETAGRMRTKGMEMALTASAMDKLLETGFDKEYGARPLRRAITSIIDDNLSEAMLRGVIQEGDVAVVDYDASTDQFEAAAVDAVGTAMGVKSSSSGANTENTYYGVSVTGIKGDPASQGFDVQWSSVGLDLEGEEFDVLRQVSNNISTRSSSPVPANDTLA